MSAYGSDDDDVEYDPSAVSVRPAPKHSSALSLHSTASVAPAPAPPRPPTTPTPAPSMSAAAAGTLAFPLLHHWRMPHKSPVTSIAMQHRGDILCVGNLEGSVFMFNFLDRADEAADGQQKQNGPSRHVHAKLTPGREHKNDASNKPFAPTRILTPFPTSYGKNHAVTQTSFFSSSNILLLGCGGDHMLSVDAGSGRQMDRSAVGSRSVLDTVRSPGHKASITDVSIMSGERYCTSSIDGTVRVWDVRKMKHGSLFAAKHGQDGAATLTTTIEVKSCSMFDGHGDMVAAGGADGVIQAWDTRSGYRPGRSAVTIASPVDTEGSEGVTRLLFLEGHLHAALYGNGQLHFIDSRRPNEPVAVAADLFAHRGELVAPRLTVRRRQGAPPTLLVVSGPPHNATVRELDIGAHGRLLREMPLGHSLRGGSATAAPPTDDSGDGIACVGLDDTNEQLVAGDGTSSVVRLHTASSKKGGPSPAQLWYEWTSGRRGDAGAGPHKRSRELVDDGALELF